MQVGWLFSNHRIEVWQVGLDTLMHLMEELPEKKSSVQPTAKSP